MKKFYLPLLFFLCTALSPSAHSQIRYVMETATGTGDGTSWNNASNDIQEMLNTVGVTEVWVAAGTYKPTALLPDNSTTLTDRDKTFFIPDGKRLYGGFFGHEESLDQRLNLRHQTILSGDIDGDETSSGNCYHVVVVAGASSGVVIDGFTISGGNTMEYSTTNPSINGMDVERIAGGGILVVSSQAIIHNNRFIYNYGWIGGGLAIKYSSTTVTNNLISYNSAVHGGGFFIHRSTTSLVNNMVENNLAGNYGGGAYLENESNNSFTNNIFYNNRSNSGGGIHMYGGYNMFYNNTFYKNIANGGGALHLRTYVGSGQMNYFVNNIFYDNKIGASSSVPQADLKIENTNIFSNNILQLQEGSYHTGNFNSINGSGNLFQVDPGFINAANPAGEDQIMGTADDGLRITCNGSAVAGGKSGNTIPTRDRIGIARSSTNPSIGAYEPRIESTAPLVLIASANTQIISANGAVDSILGS